MTLTRSRMLNGGASAGSNLVQMIIPETTAIVAVQLNCYINSVGGGDAWYCWVSESDVVPQVNDVETQGTLLHMRGIVMGTTPGYNGSRQTSISGIFQKIERGSKISLHTRAAAGQVTAQVIVYFLT